MNSNEVKLRQAKRTAFDKALLFGAKAKLCLAYKKVSQARTYARMAAEQWDIYHALRNMAA